VYILSTESNPVVGIRAKKLKVPVLQGVSNKLETLTQICSERSYDLRRILFIGNDLNDFSVMKNCGFSACPSDSHVEIKKISQFKLKAKGGNGVAREILEEIFKLDFLKYL
jgi:YrbI family 3-deoxy-D-manno-octulosonate 8-phosphate phosphatase